MTLLAVLICIVVLEGSRGETDLSLNNCPSDFNITAANTTTGIGNSDLAASFFSAYMSDPLKTKIENYMIDSNPNEISKIANVDYLWPYILLGIFFLIAFIIVVMCMIFQKSCPPCQSWRRDFAKRPYQLFEIRCVAIFAVLFSIGIFATSIAALTIIPTGQTALKNTKCAIYGALDVALNGDNNKWGGFSHIKDQVGNISKLLNSTNSQINNFFDDNTNLKDSMNSMKADNIRLYTTNKDAMVNTPDPNPLASALQTNSWFIKTYLGPTTAPNTMTNDLQAGLNITEGLSNQANEIIKSAFIIVDSSATISSNTAAGQQDLTMYENQLNTFKTNLDSLSNQYFDPIFNFGIYVVEAIVGLTVIASLAVIIGSVSIHFLNILECRHFLHFGWVIYGLTYFGVVFACYELLPKGSMGYTFCNYYNGMLTSQIQYNRLGQAYSQNVLNKLDICLYGSGNVLSKFKVLNQMNTVSQLFTNINTFKNLNDPTHTSFINQTISTSRISSWLSVLQKYRVGFTDDVDPSLATDANAVIALGHLNQYTLRTAANANDPIQRCSRDRWVFDGSRCTVNQSMYLTAATQTQGTTINMGFDNCISLQTKLFVSSPSIWTVVDIQKRYKQIKQTCGSAYNIINSYAGSITRYRDSRINLFQSLIDELTALQSSHISFNANLDAFRANLSSFSSTQTIVDLNNFVTNQINGLLVSSNCSPIGDRMRFVYNTFCINAMGSVVQLGICMIVLLCLMIGGMFTACVFAQRSATIKRLGHVIDKNLPVLDNSVHSQTFAKKQKSQTSSSSQEQD